MGNMTERAEELAMQNISPEKFGAEFKKLVNSMGKRRGERILEMIQNSGLSNRQFGIRCGKTGAAVGKWLDGLPIERETLKLIGLAASQSVPGMNKLLERYGGYPALNAKNRDDAICEYVITHASDNEDMVSHYKDIIRRVDQTADTYEEQEDRIAETSALNNAILEADDDEELIQLINDNAIEQVGAYKKLYEFIYERIRDTDDASYGFSSSIDTRAAQQGWSDGLRRFVYNKQPGVKYKNTRHHIICIGIYLGLYRSELDEMLEMARMNGLYARDPAEGTIIYALEDAARNGLYEKNEIQYASRIYEHVCEVMEDMVADSRFRSELMPYIREFNDED